MTVTAQAKACGYKGQGMPRPYSLPGEPRRYSGRAQGPPTEVLYSTGTLVVRRVVRRRSRSSILWMPASSRLRIASSISF